MIKKTTLLGLALGVSIVNLMHVSAQSITINMADEYQTISGFGGMSHTTWINDLNADNREKAFGNKPGELGLSILRIHLDPNPDLFSLELPTALSAIQNNAIVFATPWHAPTALLVPDVTPGKVDPAKYGDYVNHLNAFNTFMANNRAPLYAISVQNEPDYGDWTRWTASEMLAFMKNNAKDIENRVMAPESFQFRREFTDPILNDSTANSHLDIVGGHIYGGGMFDYPLAREKGKEVWMTEHYTESSHSANDWPLALDVATEINNCMKANFNAYIWWYIRRFYGFIDDGGIITKRGYIMSQYSKFIRPGAVRVGGTISSAPNVDVTAFKTDTSLVIAVVNRNNSPVNLSFSLQNGSIDTLTKYTTSDTKNLKNDGGISVTGGTFSASVDASSITTFTNITTPAGKYGNIAPVAVAGSDIVVVDSNGDGSETLVFDGSLSTDSDGYITNFSWSAKGVQTSTDTVFEYVAGIGEHVIVLAVTDNDGAVHSDTISVKVNSLKNTLLWLEAECGVVGSNWKVSTNTNASNSKFVEAIAGIQSSAAPSTDTADHILFTFHVPEEGNYKIWGRVITPSPNDDSFWIKMDDAPTWAMWNSIPGGNNWHWAVVFDQNTGSEVISYMLEEGEHTLHICLREDGAQLDKLALINTGVEPTGLGDEADNCPVDTTSPVNTLGNRKEIPAVAVYPNPAHDEIKVTWENAFTMLEVFSLTGERVIMKTLNTPALETSLELDLVPGIYVLKLSSESNIGIKKLLIE